MIFMGKLSEKNGVIYDAVNCSADGLTLISRNRTVILVG